MPMCDLNQLRQFIANNFLFSADFLLDDKDSFVDAGILDSMGVLHLILFLEENYHFKLADDEIVPENLDSIHNLTTFLTHKLNGATRSMGVPTGLNVP